MYIIKTLGMIPQNHFKPFGKMHISLNPVLNPWLRMKNHILPSVNITIYQVKFLSYSSQSIKKTHKRYHKRANYFSLDSPKTDSHYSYLLNRNRWRYTEALTTQLFKYSWEHRGTHTGSVELSHTILYNTLKTLHYL